MCLSNEAEIPALQLKHCLPPIGSATEVQVSRELADRMKSSLKSISDAMQVVHQAATQADRALHLQPGWFTAKYFHQ